MSSSSSVAIVKGAAPANAAEQVNPRAQRAHEDLVRMKPTIKEEEEEATFSLDKIMQLYEEGRQCLSAALDDDGGDPEQVQQELEGLRAQLDNYRYTERALSECIARLYHRLETKEKHRQKQIEQLELNITTCFAEKLAHAQLEMEQLKVVAETHARDARQLQEALEEEKVTAENLRNYSNQIEQAKDSEIQLMTMKFDLREAELKNQIAYLKRV